MSGCLPGGGQSDPAPAETYLRLVAEAGLRQRGRPPGHLPEIGGSRFALAGCDPPAAARHCTSWRPAALRPGATSLDVILSGPGRRVQATVPLDWGSGR